MAITEINIASGSLALTGQEYYYSVLFNSSPLDGVSGMSGGRLAYGPIALNPDNDKTFYTDPLIGTSGLFGDVLSRTFLSDPLDGVSGLSATAIMGAVADDSWDSESQFNGVSGLFGNAFLLPLKKNWVAWSKIGDIRIITDRTNEAGERPMPWNGWAYRAIKLGNKVIVYGADGIAMLTPVIEPTTTFGLQVVKNFGIQNPMAVAGTDQVHFFVSVDCKLYAMTLEGPKDLGYKEFLSTLVGEGLGRMILLYDESKEILYINNGSKGYSFGAGLGGGFAILTGVSRENVMAPSALNVMAIDLTTQEFDFQDRGIKNVTFVELGAYSDLPFFISLDYRHSHSEAWKSSPWIQANNEGAAYLNVSGIEFRLNIKQLADGDSQLSYVKIHYKFPDRRFNRSFRNIKGEQ